MLRIQPDEGISLSFQAKVPGMRMRIRPVKMDFRYGTSFGDGSPEAYERLLLDAMLGDATLFISADEVDHSWRLITPLIRVLEANPGPRNSPTMTRAPGGPPMRTRYSSHLTPAGDGCEAPAVENTENDA